MFRAPFWLSSTTWIRCWNAALSFIASVASSWQPSMGSRVPLPTSTFFPFVLGTLGFSSLQARDQSCNISIECISRW